MKKIVSMISVLCMILTMSVTIIASENPYDYSGEPTRAIYYTLPTMKGDDVRWVQAALNKFGNYGLAIDGSFGPACKSATAKFQAAMGLEQDGSFGPATRAAMVNWLSQNSASDNTGSAASNANSPYNYSGEPSRAIYYTLPTMKGDDVKWVQAALNAFGNYGLAIDGSFGSACKTATAKFQSAMGLSQDGSFGPSTRQTMVDWLRNNGYGPVSSSGNSSAISASGKTFIQQGDGGCYTASAAMIMSNLGATWNGMSATYQNVYNANGYTAYLSGSTPGKFGCKRYNLETSKNSVIDAVKQYPQGVMVAFYQPNKGWNHCMVAVGLNASGEPLFYDPAVSYGSNGGYGFTLSETTAGGAYGGASWNNLLQVSVIVK
ncbi:MAG TPA: peptidoglycan-binding protein [Firmicutes bacterium]|nr:peptidoglycan-binding protein [Bacillota bacterium]